MIREGEDKGEFECEPPRLAPSAQWRSFDAPAIERHFLANYGRFVASPGAQRHRFRVRLARSHRFDADLFAPWSRGAPLDATTRGLLGRVAGAPPARLLHETIHGWTATAWWRYVDESGPIDNEQARWPRAAGHAFTEVATELLVQEAGLGHPGSYDRGIDYLRGLHIPREVFAAALFGGDVTRFERALTQRSRDLSPREVFSQCARFIGINLRTRPMRAS